MRLIDADALIKVLEIFLKDHKTILAKRMITNLIAIIDNQTGIEAKPVVHAHWNKDGECSNCKAFITDKNAFFNPLLSFLRCSNGRINFVLSRR